MPRSEATRCLCRTAPHTMRTHAAHLRRTKPHITRAALGTLRLTGHGPAPARTIALSERGVRQTTPITGGWRKDSASKVSALSAWTEPHPATRVQSPRGGMDAWRCARAKPVEPEGADPKRSAVRRLCTSDSRAPCACGKKVIQDSSGVTARPRHLAEKASVPTVFSRRWWLRRQCGANGRYCGNLGRNPRTKDTMSRMVATLQAAGPPTRQHRDANKPHACRGNGRPAPLRREANSGRS